jgi:hypothetical protein
MRNDRGTVVEINEEIAGVCQEAEERKSRKARRQHDGEIMDGQVAGVCQEAEEPKGLTAA